MNPSGNPSDQPDTSNPPTTPPNSAGTVINPTPAASGPAVTPAMPPELIPEQQSVSAPQPTGSATLSSPTASQPEPTPTQPSPVMPPDAASSSQAQQVDNPRTPAPDASQQPQPGPLSPSTPLQAPPKSKKKLLVILAVAVLGLLGLVIGLTVLLGSLNSTPKYSDLKSSTVGTVAGQKITFSYPEEMEEVVNKDNEAKYAHYKDDSKKTIYAEINVDSAQTGPLTPENVASFNGILKSKKEGYQEIIDALKKDTFKDQTDITYTNFTDFKSDKVSNAVQTEISFKSTSTGKPGKGRLILAFGKERLFGMILVSEQSVWEKNTATWDKVVNSWAIDQP